MGSGRELLPGDRRATLEIQQQSLPVSPYNGLETAGLPTAQTCSVDGEVPESHDILISAAKATEETTSDAHIHQIGEPVDESNPRNIQQISHVDQPYSQQKTPKGNRMLRILYKLKSKIRQKARNNSQPSVPAAEPSAPETEEEGDGTADDFRGAYVRTAQRGTYHFAVSIKTFSNKGVIEEFVVKDPGHGTLERWTTGDEQMLAREVETMQLVYATMHVPVPRIMAWSATLGNDLGLPYIIMRCVPGVPASHIWFHKSHNPSMADNTADYSSLETEKKHVWLYADDIFAIETLLPDSDGEYTTAQMELRGIHKFLNLVLALPVFQSEPNDFYVLQHDDLDLQNILTDENGNITGLIDWDGSLAVPHCIGPAAVPVFLRRDWYPRYSNRRLDITLSLAHYRKIYATAMVEAGNPVAMYTTKSMIYQAAFAAIYEGG
ncbi:hypothetical protein EK21DRAFT_86693 [Setomelanomma holmii]|uniref:Aminoglycoside phosphotransferase domain-containing protein n=1 Tax=Setomelanomma holmii TaxID=210430 RepID=A0A9P4HGQ3_9PLEO|nr:hypothetical protein EK21DRAFT_86693 [Setomelanomma holmii]